MARDKAYYQQLLSNTNVVAYLNAISKLEAPTYYTANGGVVYVPPSAAHPDVILAGGTTAAFGRYQFMPNTWNGTILPAVGSLDIREPRDQDIAAIYLLDYRGTLDDVINGNCSATLDKNSYEWASIPTSSSGFRYGGQGSNYNAASFCQLVDSLKGSTLPKGPLVNNSVPVASNNGSSPSLSPAANSPYGSANFSDITCPPINEEDLYRANFQITNPGCKISGPVQPITGPNTNGGTVRSSNGVNNPASFSVNSQGTGQCSSLRSPTKGVAVNSPFGWRSGRPHNGVDLAADEGTPIYAASNGTVDYAQWNDGGYGNRIEIVSPEGIRTTYNHLSAMECNAGQQITVGQLIAKMGTTGHSTGPHLHFEVLVNAKVNGDQGSFIDPQSCLTFT